MFFLEIASEYKILFSRIHPVLVIFVLPEFGVAFKKCFGLVKERAPYLSFCFLWCIPPVVTTPAPEPCTEFEWQCRNGDCIDRSLRCDRKYDSRDGTDEFDCGGFFFHFFMNFVGFFCFCLNRRLFSYFVKSFLLSSFTNYACQQCHVLRKRFIRSAILVQALLLCRLTLTTTQC